MKEPTKNKLLGLAIVVPFLFLLAFALDLRFPLFRIFMAERKYLLAQTLPEGYSGFAVLEKSIVPLGKDSEQRDKIAAKVPPHPSIKLAMMDSALHPYSAATMVVDGSVSSIQAELAAIHYRDTGIPVKFTRIAKKTKSFVSASSVEYDSRSASARITVLLEKSCTGAISIKGAVNGLGAYSGNGEKLPKDRKLSFAIPADTPEAVVALSAEFPGARGKEEITLRFNTKAAGRAKILLVSRRQTIRSVLAALYPVKNITPEGLGQENIFLYELIVLDGIPLSDFAQSVSARLADYVKRGAGSLLFVADSSKFAKAGDAPVIENLLPVDLFPRSLKNLPDMSLLLLIDTSGSMFGDKLSLAKVTGAETFTNLKPDDLVGVLLFSEGYSWLTGFTAKSGIELIPNLDPVKAGGGTRLFQALQEGIKKIKDTSMPIKHIVLISDGVTEPADFEYAIANAANSNITISTMAIGDNYNHELLSGIALGTGGSFYSVKSADEIPSLLLEDQKNMARSVFSAGNEKITTMFGTDAGTVTGMARFTPRKEGIVLFSTPSGDPLLASREINSRSVFIFASDIYSAYTKDFFANSAALGLFKTVLDRQFREQAPSYTVTETGDQITIVVQSDYFVKPSIAIIDGSGAVIQDGEMAKTMPSWYAAAAFPEFDSSYTAVISDCGTTLARFPFFRNGNMAASTDTSMRADDEYRGPAFALLPGKKIWLILFFLSSLGLTISRRMLK